MLEIRINGPLIVTRMLEKGYGVRETCQRSGLSSATLRKLMNGQMTRMDSVGRLMKTLDLSANELVDFDGKQ